GAETGAEVPDLVGPFLELGVVRHPAVERDGVVLGAARRLAAAARVAPFAMFYDFSRALEAADLADAGDVTAVPFDAELEVLVRIEPLWIDTELRHGALPSSDFDLAGHLLDLDDDEFCRLERRKPDYDVDDAEIDVVLRCRLAVALDEVGVFRRGALERPLTEQAVHERPEVQPDLRPQPLVVRLEDDPFRAFVEALLDVQRRSPNRYVFPFARRLVGAVERA